MSNKGVLCLQCEVVGVRGALSLGSVMQQSDVHKVDCWRVTRRDQNLKTAASLLTEKGQEVLALADPEALTGELRLKLVLHCTVRVCKMEWHFVPYRVPRFSCFSNTCRIYCLSYGNRPY